MRPTTARGQAMVEFAVILLPIMLVLVGIIQFGFLFAAYVGTSNATREAARAGTIYFYQAADTQSVNDASRCAAVLAAASASFDQTVPGRFAATCSTANGDGADLVISYPDASTCSASSRTGCQIHVRLTYHTPVFVPLVAAFLNPDGDDTIPLSATVTMVMN